MFDLTGSAIGDDRIVNINPGNRDMILFDVPDVHDFDHAAIQVSFDPVQSVIELTIAGFGSVTFNDISGGFLEMLGTTTIDELNSYSQGMAGYDLVTFI